MAFYLALRTASVPAELHIFENAPHGVGLDLADSSVGEGSTLQWVPRWLSLLLHAVQDDGPGLVSCRPQSRTMNEWGPKRQ